MIFSGSSRGLKCSSCGHEIVDATPTSILPLLLTIGLGASLWIRVLSQLELESWLTKTLGVVLALSTYSCFYWVFEVSGRSLLLHCEDCGGDMEVTYSGFYDGWIPHSIELVIYFFSLATPFLVILIVEAPGSVGYSMMNAAILFVGTLLLAVLNGLLAGRESVNLHVGTACLVTVLGSVLYLVWDWIPTFIILTLLTLWSIFGGLVERKGG
ncbi:MAG: hypothetical protein QGI68_17345 [Pseudomonadales bacterium]|nr:hypothetical protein [Pseudomonadales bacterium]